MNIKKNQKIIVLTSLSDADNSIISHGIKIAAMFSKELCLAYHTKRRKKETRQNADRMLMRYKAQISEKANGLVLSTLISDVPVKLLSETLADHNEAIMLIAASIDYKFYAPTITESPVPFLFVGSGCKVENYQKAVLPVDLRRENSDTVLWCSWLGRFGHIHVDIIAANDGTGSSQQQVIKNVKLTRALFQKSGVVHRIIKGRRSSLFNSFEASDFALASDADLLVLLGSSTITPIDRLIGLPERKIIRKAVNMLVLLVNPRRDNYILCDG